MLLLSLDDFLVAQRLKRLPAMQETRVRFLDREDPLEEEMATHSNTLAWRIPWMEEPGGLQSKAAKSWTRLSDKLLLLLEYIRAPYLTCYSLAPQPGLNPRVT